MGSISTSGDMAVNYLWEVHWSNSHAVATHTNMKGGDVDGEKR